MMSRGKKSKGQMFLIGAIVIVTSLVVIKYTMSGPAAKKEKEVLEVKFEHEIFKNIVNELNNSLKFSYYELENITKNIFEFANFTERKMMDHSMGFTFLYIGALCNKTTSIMNVSLVNMLDSAIDANFTLNDSSKQSNETTDIVNYERWNANFTITPGNVYALNLTYNITTGGAITTTTETIIVKTKSNKDTYVGFFDVSLQSQDATHKEKYQKTITIH